MTRKPISFSGTLEAPPLQEPRGDAAAPTTAQHKEANEFLATFLVGGGVYNGILVPVEELAKAAPGIDRKPVNLDHKGDVDNEVGFVRQPTMFERALKGFIVLNPKTSKFAIARGYIENRLAAGTAPEVSVGFYADIDESQDPPVASNLAFDHLALVSRGACSPQAGCGVGLSNQSTPQGVNMTTEPTTPPAAPAPEEPAKEAAPEAPVAPPECGCKALKAEVEALKLRLAEAPTRFKLASEAEALGVPVEEKDGVECLSKKIALARAVLAKAPKFAETPVRHTAVAASKTDEALRLFRLFGA